MKKILVPITLVPDVKTTVALNSALDGPSLDGLAMAINPYDELALEAAIVLKEEGKVERVLVVNIGKKPQTDLLQKALAMGADDALMIISGDIDLTARNTALLLEAVVRQEDPQMVLCGNRVVDEDRSQVTQRLAARLDWPQAIFISQLEWHDDHVKAGCETEEGIMFKHMTFPCIASADLGLSEPRYLSMRDLIQARQKEIRQIEASQIVDASDMKPSQVKITGWANPPAAPQTQQLSSVSELFHALQTNDEEKI